MTDKKLDQTISDWLEAQAPKQVSDRVLRAAFERTRKTRQRVGWRVLLGRLSMPRFAPALATAAIALVVGVVALGFYFSGQGIGVKPSLTPSPSLPPSPSPLVSPSPSPFEPIASPGVCLTPIPLGTDALLDCSGDGTRVLVQRDRENLFILDADGSETQVTERELPGIPWQTRGATISPDGSRVIFGGVTKTPEEARNCHDGGLFAVDADGGPAELLWVSQIPQNGWITHPTFSPDGTEIAFVDGYCDWGHTVWVMNADGTDAHQIVANETTLGGGHVTGLAWSQAGDQIALAIDIAGTFSFAPDGSDFTKADDVSEFCWPGRRC